MPRGLARILEPLDKRFDLTNRVLNRWFHKPVTAHARRFWFCFGGLTFFVFILQGLTGMFLTLYYEPTPERAYASVFYISNFVHYGWLIRSVHAWGSQLMVLFVVVHMLRVYITASYKHPREFNWVVGVILLAVTLAFGLTGELLPWDQSAYWGSTEAIAIVRQLPMAGDSIARVIVGGDTLGSPTLLRFYSAHIMLLPAALIGMLYTHFWMVREQGISEPL